MPSALLFTGMDGIGKTLMAKEFVRALLCRAEAGGPAASCGACPDCLSVDKGIHPDFKRVGADYQASLREEEAAKQKTLRVETIRHLRRDMEMRSLMGFWKIAVIEDAHTLEPEAANALLKILEEPPEKTLWILLTAQRERMLKTVVSRCFSVPFAPLSPATVSELLMAKGIDAARASKLCRICEGSVSRALSLDENLDEYTALESNPAAAIAAAEGLPRELYLARLKVESALYGLAQALRLKYLEGAEPFGRVEGPLRKLLALRQALASNADPRLVMILAGETARLQPS